MSKEKIAAHIEKRFAELRLLLEANPNTEICIGGILNKGEVKEGRETIEDTGYGGQNSYIGARGHLLGTGLAKGQWKDKGEEASWLATVQAIDAEVNNLFVKYPGRVSCGNIHKSKKQDNVIRVWGANAGNWNRELGAAVGRGDDGQAKVIGTAGLTSFGIVTTPASLADTLQDEDKVFGKIIAAQIVAQKEKKQNPQEEKKQADGAKGSIDYDAMYNEAIQCYRLPYGKETDVSNQKKFNDLFKLNDKPEKGLEKGKKYLQQKLDATTEAQRGEYFTAVQDTKSPRNNSRDNREGSSGVRVAHDGMHGVKTAYYAQICFDLYKRYTEHLPQNLQQEIKEFDANKLQELRILSVMHDVARTKSGMDLDEYKNAFYAALLLEKHGYSREDAITLASHLADKGNATLVSKSLMSKLIESADCAAITRLYPFGSGFNMTQFNLYQDF
jgi:hypothetical protein